MTAADASVILVGLVTGYVLVSWLISRRHEHRQTWTNPPPRRNHEEWSPHAQRENPANAHAPWYEILRVPATASLDEIKLAYRRRIGEYHPDKTSGLGDELKVLAEEKSKLINTAYEEALRTFVK